VARRLCFVPNDNRGSDTAPAFRIFIGRSRIGDAWSARSNGENPKDDLWVRLDDRCLRTPHHAVQPTDSLRGPVRPSGGHEQQPEYYENENRTPLPV